MITKEAAQQALWRQGILRWMLDDNQKEFYDAFYKCTGLKFVLNCSRQIGKSYFLCVLAIEHALRIPDGELKYSAPTQKQVKKIIFPLFKQILKDCPEDLKPNFHAQEQQYEFKNGATIVIAGMDSDRADNLRGSRAHLGIVDEAGFSSSAYVTEMVQGVLLPMTLTTGGKLVIASTPPKTPHHAFQKYYTAALAEGNALHRTIYDNPRLTSETIDKYKKESGGDNTTYWKREYLAQFVIDKEIIVFPEFSERAQAEIIVDKYERPKYFDYYTAIDVGIRDATAVLFGYWDFLNTKLVIEDEILLHGVLEVRTDIIAAKVRLKEEEHFGKKEPYFRISDIDLLLINDLDKIHNLKFHPAKKGNYSKEAGVNEVRLMINTRQLVINSRCKHLAAQLESCIWDTKHEKFDRVEGMYHFDAVDALIYIVRGLRRNKNPYPADRYDIDSQFFWNQPSNKTPTGQTFVNIFKQKKFD